MKPLVFLLVSYECVCCKLGKSERLSFKDVNHTCDKPLQIMHSYVWHSPFYSNLGYRYYVSFIDDYSHFTCIYPMKRKSEVFHQFLNFKGNFLKYP